MHEPFIAVDWGTTNRRAWRIADGVAGAAHRDQAGISRIAAGGYPAAAAQLRAALGGGPLLLAGMVGADRGWADAGYVRTPATLRDLADGLVRVAPEVRIVPGVSLVGPATAGVQGAMLRGDVMRGEEVQLLGAVAAGLVPPDARLCQPGTHCKWARMADGAIADFSTAMTGELFAVLRDHALIGRAMAGPVADGPAFREGLTRAGAGDLATALFGVRASSVLGLRPDTDAASYVSGLLIGADCRAAVVPGEHVHLLADSTLGPLYAAAITDAGGTATLIDSEAAFLAGIVRIWELA